MNYNSVEILISKINSNDEFAKEQLIKEFTPLILNTCKKTFVHGYENEDIINECYSTLFKCIKLYNPESHRFVAYATNAIKNNINYLIRKNKNRSKFEGKETLVLCDNLEHVLSDSSNLEEDILNSLDFPTVAAAFKDLDENELDLIQSIFLRQTTLKSYSISKNISYTTASKRKRSALNKLNKALKVTY